MATDTECRDVARRLRGAKYGRHSWERALYDALGVDLETVGLDMLDHLADIIDPTCEVHRDSLFYPATDLMHEHEETVYRCGSCDGMVSYDEDYDPETDAPAYCETCGSRITGIGESWDE